jgi:hypothetical protein
MKERASYLTKQKVTKHEFTFSGLVNCGHCGCALVAEKKCSKRALLIYSKVWCLDDQVMDWIVEALHQCPADEKRFRENAITRLQEQLELSKGLFCSKSKTQAKSGSCSIFVFELHMERSNSNRNVSPTV